jgi:hypothetical protein
MTVSTNIVPPIMNVDLCLGLANELQRQMEEKGVKSATDLTKHLHFYPDLHGESWFSPPLDQSFDDIAGNRSPLADPKMTGSIMGLTLVGGIFSPAFDGTLLTILQGRQFR